MRAPVRSISTTFLVVLLLLALADGATLAAPAAPAPPGFALGGQVQNARQFTVQDLQKLPSTQVSVSFVTDHGQESGSYSGVLLWALLNDAGIVNGAAKGALLRHVIAVTGRDGYAVVLSAGELAPDFEGKSVILAIAKNGQPLAQGEGVRLIVPGDKHGGRAVRDVVKIDVE